VITVRNLWGLTCTIVVVGGCDVAREPLAPVERMQGPSAPLRAVTSSTVTYRVQAFTSFNGQIYNIPSCLESAWMTWEHNIGPTEVHVDSIMSVRQVGTCGAPSPWNGGWIDVYEVRANGDHYVGQVGGDMVWKDFSYAGPDYLQIRLRAFPDLTQNCQFQYFDNYPPGQNSIVVSGGGDLPLAQFYCTS
jgi:hypothetical protein